jgi:hypothetical protein
MGLTTASRTIARHSSAKGAIQSQPRATPWVGIRNIFQSPEWAAQNLRPWFAPARLDVYSVTVSQCAATLALD